MQKSPGTLATEFRRVLALDSLGLEDERLEFSATNEEGTALAERFGVLAVTSLTATAWVRREGKDGARARVQFTAVVIQSCVATFEPVRACIQEGFELDFLPATACTEVRAGGIATDPDADEPPGVVVDGAFDLGEVIAEYVSLAIDPYPRKPDAEVTWRQDAGKEGEQVGPFSALKRWRGKA